MIRQPDDWHLHLRDGEILDSLVDVTARVFRRAIVMPNLNPPITTIQAAISYRQRILSSLKEGLDFQPLLTAYLTDDLSPKVLKDGFEQKVFFAAKLYPANSTTNSSKGVTDINVISPLIETMENIGMPLLIHGEVTDPDIDIFDREAVFIDKHLMPLLKRYPGLRVVLEHITTEKAVQFVESCDAQLGATITPHHLHINRNAMFLGGLRSDFYCLPIAKREHHRLALRRAATSGRSCFFLGTDSAPHLRGAKVSSCGCAGIFNAKYALESYVEVFDEEEALDKLEAFASENGPNFYGLPLNEKFIKLVQRNYLVEELYEVKNERGSLDHLVPFHAGERLHWHALSVENRM